MSDSFDDFPPARATADVLTTEQINEAMGLNYWREAWHHLWQVKASCSCQGRAEKLWCKRCNDMLRYQRETGVEVVRS